MNMASMMFLVVPCDSLWIRLTTISAGLPSLATMLLNRSIRALLQQIDRELIKINNGDEYYEALK